MNDKKQTNNIDAAIELTKLYYTNKKPKDVEELQDTYIKFYSAAVLSENFKIDLYKYVPKGSLDK